MVPIPDVREAMLDWEWGWGPYKTDVKRYFVSKLRIIIIHTKPSLLPHWESILECNTYMKRKVKEGKIVILEWDGGMEGGDRGREGGREGGEGRGGRLTEAAIWFIVFFWGAAAVVLCPPPMRLSRLIERPLSLHVEGEGCRRRWHCSLLRQEMLFAHTVSAGCMKSQVWCLFMEVLPYLSWCWSLCWLNLKKYMYMWSYRAA